MVTYKAFFVGCILAAQVFLTIQQDGICSQSNAANDGTDYVAHPFHCDQYIQCYHKDKKNLNVGITRTCDTGLHWNPARKRCEEPTTAGCKNDFCNLMCENHFMKDNCRGYYSCNNKTSESHCCPEGKLFVWGKGCIEDENDECHVPCKLSSFPCKEPVCKRKPNWEHPGSFHYTFFGTTFWFGQLCENNDFDAVTCGCTAGKYHKCRPDRNFNLADHVTAGRVVAGKVPGISTTGNRDSLQGITLGPKQMIHIDATSTTGNEPFTIKFSYRENPNALPDNYATILLSSNLKCAGERYGTLYVYVHKGFLSADLKTLGHRNDHVDVLLNGMKQTSFKDVTVVYDRGQLTMSVEADGQLNIETVPASKKALFPCGFDFGSTDDYDGFQGVIGKISLSSCTPARLY